MNLGRNICFYSLIKKFWKENFYENFKKEKKVVLNFKGIKKIGRKHYWGWWAYVRNKLFRIKEVKRRNQAEYI